MPTLFRAPTQNFISTTLNGGISDAATTITLNSVTGLQANGYLVINREDGSGNATPNAREVIYFTGISGSQVTGVTRGADGSTARSHSDGALVETTVTVGIYNSLVSIIDLGLDNNGYLRAIASPVSIARLELNQIALNSIASIARAEVSTLIAPSALVSVATVLGQLNASGASIVGFPAVIGWQFSGSISGATTLVQTPIPSHRAATWSFVNFVTRTVSSGASSYVDLNKNGVSIFEAGTRPVIAGGGTFYSSASILTRNVARGDRFYWDFDNTTPTHITDFDILLVSE